MANRRIGALIALVVVLLGAALWYSRTPERKADLPPTYPLVEVEASRNDTLIRVQVYDSCSANRAEVLVRERSDEVVISSERGTFARCADGFTSPGTVELRSDLGGRALIVEQPPRRFTSEPLVCLIDGEPTDQCAERTWSE